MLIRDPLNRAEDWPSKLETSDHILSLFHKVAPSYIKLATQIDCSLMFNKEHEVALKAKGTEVVTTKFTVAEDTSSQHVDTDKMNRHDVIVFPEGLNCSVNHSKGSILFAAATRLSICLGVFIRDTSDF